jgi:hypothetical protein
VSPSVANTRAVTLSLPGLRISEIRNGQSYDRFGAILERGARFEVLSDENEF